MKKLSVLVCLAALAGAAHAQPAHVKRLNAAATVLAETLGMKDAVIPQDLLDRSYCGYGVVVVEFWLGSCYRSC
jgi:hypothetical protein